MAEMCFDCYKKYHDPNAREAHFVLSGKNELDLCEFCGQYKQTIITERFFYLPGYVRLLIKKLLNRS